MSGLVREEAPLADSNSYQGVTAKLILSQRGPALTTLRACLNSKFQLQRLTVASWWCDPYELRGMDGGPLPGLNGRPVEYGDTPLLPFQVSQDMVKKYTGKHSKEPDSYTCLRWVDDIQTNSSMDAFQYCRPGSLEFIQGPDCSEQIACVVTLSALWVHGFLDVNHTITPPQPQLMLTHFGSAALEFSHQFMAEGLRVLGLVMVGEVLVCMWLTH